MDQPIGFWFLENREERRPRYRRLRPRQLAPIVPAAPDDSSSDEFDSPSPSTTSFPSSTTAPPPAAQPTDVVANPVRPPIAEQPAAGETERAQETTSSEFQPRPTELSTFSTLTTESTTTTSIDTTSSSSSSSTETDSSSSSSSTGQPTADAASQAGFDNAGRTVDPKLGIAFGSIGAAAVLLCIGVGIWWCMRRRSRRKVEATPPVSRAPSQLYTQEAAARLDQRSMRRAPSSLMGELMTAAYADGQGQGGPGQQSMGAESQFNEKGPHVVASQASPSGFAANARTSIASWVNRLNPLRLNSPTDPYLSSRQSFMSGVQRAVPADASAPPVPAVPALFQSRGIQRDDDKEPLVQPPQPAIRPPSSRYELPVDDVHRSSFSFYGRDSMRRDDVPALRTMRPQRPPSMAPTIHTTISGADTESSWQSWGAGLGRPQYQPDPMPSPKGWLQKVPGFGSK